MFKQSRMEEEEDQLEEVFLLFFSGSDALLNPIGCLSSSSFSAEDDAS